MYILYIYPHYLSSHHIVAINNHIIYHPVDILSMSNMVTTTAFIPWMALRFSERGRHSASSRINHLLRVNHMTKSYTVWGFPEIGIPNHLKNGVFSIHHPRSSNSWGTPISSNYWGIHLIGKPSHFSLKMVVFHINHHFSMVFPWKPSYDIHFQIPWKQCDSVLVRPRLRSWCARPEGSSRPRRLGRPRPHRLTKKHGDVNDYIHIYIWFIHVYSGKSCWHDLVQYPYFWRLPFLWFGHMI